MKCLFHHTRVLEKGTREEHAFPATRPAAYKKNLGKIGWLLLLVCNKEAKCGGLHLSLCVCVCVCLCFCLLLSAHSSETIPPTTKHVPPVLSCCCDSLTHYYVVPQGGFIRFPPAAFPLLALPLKFALCTRIIN